MRRTAKKIDNLRQKVVDFFIQSEGLVCNRREAYVIRLPCKRYGIKPQGLYFSSFGLITYLSTKGLHTSLRDDYTPSCDGLHARLSP